MSILINHEITYTVMTRHLRPRFSLFERSSGEKCSRHSPALKSPCTCDFLKVGQVSASGEGISIFFCSWSIQLEKILVVAH